MDKDLQPSPEEPWGDGFEPEAFGPLHEWPPTDKVTVLMESVLANDAKGVAFSLSRESIIWNQRGPCGRKPEQVAFDLGYLEIHAMLVARREFAQLQAGIRAVEKQGPLRL